MLINLLIWIGLIWFFLIVFYTGYIASIQIYRDWQDIPLWIVIVMSPIYVPFLLLDIVVQWTIANLLFLDLARELTLSERLGRYRTQKQYAGDWRYRVATYICTKALNPFDPTKAHC